MEEESQQSSDEYVQYSYTIPGSRSVGVNFLPASMVKDKSGGENEYYCTHSYYSLVGLQEGDDTRPVLHYVQ